MCAPRARAQQLPTHRPPPPPAPRPNTTPQDNWSPVHSICTLLTSIQSLLTDPNCASPANPEAAKMYKDDRPAYNKRVRRLAQKSVDGC